MSFQSEFVNPMRLSRRYKEWAEDSPGDVKRFDMYALYIAQGKRPTIPAMTTNFGRALVGAGKPWLPAATPPPTPPPVVSPSVFAGRGCFTAHDPLVLVREGIADRFDWVALKGDGGDHANESDAVELRRTGAKRIHLWYANDAPLMLVPSQVNADGLISQAEGPEQAKLGASRLVFASCPVALITNNYMASIDAAKWPVVLAESYWNVVSEASPGSCTQDSLNRMENGPKVAYPVFGVGGTWAEAFRVVPLQDYVKAWSPTNWSCYLGEYLTPADIAYLKSLPR